MLLPRDTSCASGGEHDIDANTLRRLWGHERRGREHLYPHRGGATPQGPLGRLWLVFCSNPADSPCACHNTACGPCAGPGGSDSRGRPQRSHAPLWCEQTPSLSWARAPQGWKKTLLLGALTPQFLQQRLAGEALYTRVHQQVTPDESPGGTVGVMARATRLLWARHCGRQERPRCPSALGLVGQVLQHTGALPLRTDGARRSGSLVCALWGQALRTGQRGRPKQALPTGVQVRRTPQGSPRHKRGPKRPHSPAPSPAHPDPAQSLATQARPATHLDAVPTARRRRWAAYRRRPDRYAKETGRLQERLDVYWRVPNVVRVHFTTRQVPAVA